MVITMIFKIAPYQLYINSFLHYCKKKTFDINGEKKELVINVLDRRFLTTNDLDEIQRGFPYCKLKHLDKYWIEVYSYYPLNQSQMFYRLLELGIIVPLEEFIRIIEGGE